MTALEPAFERIAAPWWIIGSAALLLHGIDDVEARDIDLMLDADDAEALVKQPGFIRLPSGTDGLFVSHVYGRRDDLPMPVELMGGFSFRHPDGLRPVRIDAPVWRSGWPVASLPDLAAMFRLFDRPKDRVRLGLIAT